MIQKLKSGARAFWDFIKSEPEETKRLRWDRSFYITKELINLLIAKGVITEIEADQMVKTID
jgi:hypothetical protein